MRDRQRGARHCSNAASRRAGGISEAEYEILIDIALGLTDRAIAHRRGLSLRSVQNRLQQIYEKLDVHRQVSGRGDAAGRNDGAFNLRARAVTVAILRKLLNYGALERAEADLADWLAAGRDPRG